MRKQRVTLTLKGHDLEKAEKVAERSGFTLAELIRFAAEGYIDHKIEVWKKIDDNAIMKVGG